MSTYLSFWGLLLAQILFAWLAYQIFGDGGAFAGLLLFPLLLIGYAIYVSEREGKNKGGEGGDEA